MSTGDAKTSAPGGYRREDDLKNNSKDDHKDDHEGDHDGHRPPDLRICLNEDPSLGFCVYAARPFARGEPLFRERTALEATHDVDPRGVRNVYDRYCALSPARRDALHGSFPFLAWANGVDAHTAAAARVHIGSRLLSKRCVLDLAVTTEEHMQMRPPGLPGTDESNGAVAGGAPTTTTSSAAWTWTRPRSLFRRSGVDFQSVGSSKRSRESSDTEGAAAAAVSPASVAAARRLTLDWFSRYAFRLKPGTAFSPGATTGGNHHQAAVYLLTDLINHRCAGFQNCRVAAEVGAITVLAVRDIAAGEEITINYSKDVKDFRCKGECCVRK